MHALMWLLSAHCLRLAGVAMPSDTCDHWSRWHMWPLISLVRVTADVALLIGRPLVKQIRGHEVQVQVQAAGALQALAQNNEANQLIFLKLDAPSALMRLLKVRVTGSMRYQQQGAYGNSQDQDITPI